MGKTRRTKRPKMRLGALEDRLLKDGTVRDGTPTHISKSCAHHGGCLWCGGSRMHSNKRRAPIPEEYEDSL